MDDGGPLDRGLLRRGGRFGHLDRLDWAFDLLSGQFGRLRRESFPGPLREVGVRRLDTAELVAKLLPMPLFKPPIATPPVFLPKLLTSR
ncbi:hypothetical protein, partial [Dactylosporangium sp. NPDC049140]|uniref:hypothetical protein n=1 Tax=Dactylosporangium sp. NPDC049140 TaxID=3155647 RepID=UPI0033FB59E9